MPDFPARCCVWNHSAAAHYTKKINSRVVHVVCFVRELQHVRGRLPRRLGSCEAAQILGCTASVNNAAEANMSVSHINAGGRRAHVPLIDSFNNSDRPAGGGACCMIGTGDEDEAEGPNSLSLGVRTRSDNNEGALMNAQLGVQAGCNRRSEAKRRRT